MSSALVMGARVLLARRPSVGPSAALHHTVLLLVSVILSASFSVTMSLRCSVAVEGVGLVQRTRVGRTVCHLHADALWTYKPGEGAIERSSCTICRSRGSQRTHTSSDQLASL